MTAAPRRSFPPPICNSRSLFHGFCVSEVLPSERRRETIFIVVFRSRRGSGKRLTASEARGPGQWAPQGQGIWPRGSTYLGPRVSACSLPSLLRFVPSKKLMLINFQVIRTAFGSLKQQNIENRGFCQCRVNSKKNRKTVKYSQNHYKIMI